MSNLDSNEIENDFNNSFKISENRDNIFDLLFNIKSLTDDELKVRNIILYNYLLNINTNKSNNIIIDDKKGYFKSEKFINLANYLEKEKILKQKLIKGETNIEEIKEPISLEEINAIKLKEIKDKKELDEFIKQKGPTNKSSGKLLTELGLIFPEREKIRVEQFDEPAFYRKSELPAFKSFLDELEYEELKLIKKSLGKNLNSKFDIFKHVFDKQGKKLNLKNREYEELFSEQNLFEFGFLIKDKLVWTAKLQQLAFVIVNLKSRNIIKATSINNAVDNMFEKKIIDIGNKKWDSLRNYCRRVESALINKDSSLEFNKEKYIPKAITLVHKLIRISNKK